MPTTQATPPSAETAAPIIRDYTPETDALDGLIRGVPEEVYFEDSTALSASNAKILLGTRAPEVTAAMELGSLTHTVLLEPHLLRQYQALESDAVCGRDARTKRACKLDGDHREHDACEPYDSPTMTGAWKDAVAAAEAEGRKVIARAEWDKAHAMAEAVRAHPTAAALLEACHEREVSAWADHPETGARVRGRLDLLGPGLVVDLKTANDADPKRFPRRAHEFGYDVQAAHYQDLARACGWDVEGFAFIVVESLPTPTGRHRVAVVELADAAIEKGRAEFADACQRWLDLGQVVDLPDFGTGIHRVDLPPYAYRRDNEDEYEEIA